MPWTVTTDLRTWVLGSFILKLSISVLVYLPTSNGGSESDPLWNPVSTYCINTQTCPRTVRKPKRKDEIQIPFAIFSEAKLFSRFFFWFVLLSIDHMVTILFQDFSYLETFSQPAFVIIHIGPRPDWKVSWEKGKPLFICWSKRHQQAG